MDSNFKNKNRGYQQRRVWEIDESVGWTTQQRGKDGVRLLPLGTTCPPIGRRAKEWGEGRGEGNLLKTLANYGVTITKAPLSLALHMKLKVGRVTPCAPLVWPYDPNGAHGVTRPAKAAGSGAQFVSLGGSWNLSPLRGESEFAQQFRPSSGLIGIIKKSNVSYGSK